MAIDFDETEDLERKSRYCMPDIENYDMSSGDEFSYEVNDYNIIDEG